MLRPSEGAAFGGRSHRELVEIRLGDDDRARVAQSLDGGGLIWTPVLREDARAAGGRRSECRNVVLDDNGNALQFAFLPVDASLVDPRSFATHHGRVAPEKRVQTVGSRPYVSGAGEGLFYHLARCPFPACNRIANFCRAT